MASVRTEESYRRKNDQGCIILCFQYPKASGHQVSNDSRSKAISNFGLPAQSRRPVQIDRWSDLCIVALVVIFRITSNLSIGLGTGALVAVAGYFIFKVISIKTAKSDVG